MAKNYRPPSSRIDGRLRKGRLKVEPYFISCTTCQSRLKVLNESVIGQIQACPKCGSMVLVTPPPLAKSGDPSTATPGPRVAASTATVPAMNAPARPKIPLPSVDLRKPAGPTPSSPHDPELSKDTKPSIDLPRTASTTLPELLPSVPDEPLSASPVWSTLTLVRLRRTALMLGAGSLGIVMAVLVFSYMIRDPRKRTELASTNVTAQPNSAADNQVGTSMEQESPNASPPGHSPSTSLSPSGSAVVPAIESEPHATPRIPIEPTESDSTTKNGSSVAQPLAPDLSAGKKKPGEITPDEKTPGESQVLNRSSNLMKTLEKFDTLTRDSASDVNQGVGATEGTVQSPSPAMETVDANATQARPPIKFVDVKPLLEVRIDAIEFSNVPLIDFLRFITQLSTIPITVPSEVLDAANASAVTPVSVRKTDITVAEVLQLALKDIGLTYRADEGHVTLTHPTWPDSADSMQTADWTVADLLSVSKGGGSELPEAITDFVMPWSWSSVGGLGTVRVEDGKLFVENDPRIVFQSLLFCERLRVLRGLSPQTELSPALFSGTIRGERAAPALLKVVSLNYSQPVALIRIIQRLEKDTTIRLLVDWQSLADVRWGANAEATLVSDKLSLSDALTTMLEPMELGWRVINENTLEITSKEQLHRRWDIESYSVSTLLQQFENPNELIARIGDRLGDKNFLLGKGGVIRIDSQSKSLIAAMPQHLHRRLTKILAELGSSM